LLLPLLTFATFALLGDAVFVAVVAVMVAVVAAAGGRSGGDDRHRLLSFKKLWFLIGPKGPHTCGMS
jgi:hypothetical protein